MSAARLVSSHAKIPRPSASTRREVEGSTAGEEQGGEIFNKSNSPPGAVTALSVTVSAVTALSGTVSGGAVDALSGAVSGGAVGENEGSPGHALNGQMLLAVGKELMA